jgi:hypothetical protein
MMSFYQWSPLLIGLGAPLLAWLLVAGRGSPRRAARLLALAAVITLVVEAAATFAAYQFRPQLAGNSDASQLVTIGYVLGGWLGPLLALGAWTVLLAAATRAGSRQRLIVLVVVFALTLALQGGLEYRAPPMFDQLREALDKLLQIGLVLQIVLIRLPVLAALACALLTPPDAPISTAPEPATPGA